MGNKGGGGHMNEHPNIEPVLKGLKDFQRKSVEHAFRRLYLETDTSGRFLVADEVGLGKTMVAKGLIAKAIDHLWDVEERIDILYICSNSDIARQNIQRLQLDRSSESKFAFATRSTLLPVTVEKLQKNKVNYISLTPGTSFDMKSSLGMWEERVLMYWLLKEAWQLKGTGPLNLLQGGVSYQTFRRLVDNYAHEKIDAGLREAYLQELEQTDLRDRFEELAAIFQYRRDRTRIAQGLRYQQNELIGELRSLLAVTSLSALNPDLIIMDEFQRFKYLFNNETEAGYLAGNLFKHTEMKTGTKILLLSATPYKMYTMHSESDSEDHYRDFVDTLQFLLKDLNRTERVKGLLDAFRREMYRLGEEEGYDSLKQFKNQLESELSRVMVRTERLASSTDRNGMLQQILPQNPGLLSADVADYVSLQSMAAVLEKSDVMEYWKTAPYLLNYMDEYSIKTAFTEAIDDPLKNTTLAEIARKNSGMFLSLEDLQKYEQLDPRNMRLREIASGYMETGIWQCLWLSPSLPYYQPAECFSQVRKPTKRLIFSSWKVVPKVLATYLSYEAERRMMRLFERYPENTTEVRAKRRGLLQFAWTDNRPTGMPIMTLLYPCETLVRTVDPLQFLGDANELPSAQHVLRQVNDHVSTLLEDLKPYETDTLLEDEAWYWAAPILLDLQNDSEKTITWWNRTDLAAIWQRGEDLDGDTTHWTEHVDRVRTLLQERKLGRQPSDLAQVLSCMALAGPAICAYRSLLRALPDGEDDLIEQSSLLTAVRDTAAQIGWSFRSLYNVPEIMALIRGLKQRQRGGRTSEPYWRMTLEYGVDGCLQAVMDEYMHLQLEAIRGINLESLQELSQRIHDVLTLRATTLAADEIRLEEDGLHIQRNGIRMRARFAQRFGDERAESGERTRVSQVRDAFNSPFWPFVLTTTSVGQEGLDFHPYCHAIVHWDLPSNPVDLEQREGRVHRYKGHAVRKNIAAVYSTHLNGDRDQNYDSIILNKDPWEHLFKLAEAEREDGEGDLVPYWLYPLEGGDRIERYVPAHHLSRDFIRLTNLRRSLAVYRMVFGQPRQEDLIQFLLEQYDEDTVKRVVDELRMDLSPKSVSIENHSV